MLDIEKVQCKNIASFCGLLKELDITEGTTSDGRGYVRGSAKIGVDSEIDGKVVENEHIIKMFAMRNKTDGTPNVMYDKILGYREQFTSAAVVEDISQASFVKVTGRVEENSYYDDKSKMIRSGYQFTGSFLNKKKPSDEEGATFEVQGVVAKMREETDRNGDPTDRLIISMVVIGFAGRADVIEFVAAGRAKTYIEENWNQGDTVIATGKIISTFRTITWEEEQGFGDPIKRIRTEGQRELLITGGSQGGADESASYDADSIKLALSKRQERLEEMKTKSANKAKPATKNTGFDKYNF